MIHSEDHHSGHMGRGRVGGFFGFPLATMLTEHQSSFYFRLPQPQTLREVSRIHLVIRRNVNCHQVVSTHVKNLVNVDWTNADIGGRGTHTAESHFKSPRRT